MRRMDLGWIHIHIQPDLRAMTAAASAVVPPSCASRGLPCPRQHRCLQMSPDQRARMTRPWPPGPLPAVPPIPDPAQQRQQWDLPLLPLLLLLLIPLLADDGAVPLPGAARRVPSGSAEASEPESAA